jgi:hypothetical protein
MTLRSMVRTACPVSNDHRRRATLRRAAATAAIIAAATFALMFVFDRPWMGTAGVVVSVIAGILIRLSRRREPPSK